MANQGRSGRFRVELSEATRVVEAVITALYLHVDPRIQHGLIAARAVCEGRPVDDLGGAQKSVLRVAEEYDRGWATRSLARGAYALWFLLHGQLSGAVFTARCAGEAADQTAEQIRRALQP